MLCVSDKYRKYANFKSRVLLKAQAELKKNTDIRFEFDELTFGRKVESIVFYIHPNNRKQVIDAPETKQIDPERPQRQQTILSFGISQAVLQSQILSLYDDGYIEQTLDYCTKYFKHTAVKHKSGFFLKALKDGFFVGEIKTTVAKKKKKQEQSKDYLEKKEAEELKATQKEEQLQLLRGQHQTTELIEQVISELQGNRFVYPIIVESRKNGVVHKYLQGYVDRKLVEDFGEV